MDLKPRNTFGMKVRAGCVVEYDSVEDLEEIRLAQTDRSLPVPMLHIGGGSNLLFTGDFPGTLLHSNIKYINTLQQEGQSHEVKVEVGAGVVFDEFCAWASDRGLWGVENLSHIPGETGAAAVQNVGAYGVEAKDIISKVNSFDMVLGKPVTFDVADCGYGYRDSLFKRDRKGRYIVTSVVFALSSEPIPRLGYGHILSAVASALGINPIGMDTEEAKAAVTKNSGLTPGLIRDVIISIRKEKLPEPSETPSAGSFFKNPVVPRSDYDKVVSIAELDHGKGYPVPHYDVGSGFVKIPAAWLIEQCGWKGYTEGNVGVWPSQPLVLVNLTGEASPEEVIALEEKIVDSVEGKFGILLSPEVEHI